LVLGGASLYESYSSSYCTNPYSTGGGDDERSNFRAIEAYKYPKLLAGEKIKLGEVTLEHRATNLMYANVLTKPLQGKQFTTERDGITNWAQLDGPEKVS
jgi:hypothetical protein